MLLPHNFDVPDIVPALSREEFVEVFRSGTPMALHCRQVSNPHWVVEILFPSEFSPQQVGTLCAKALAKKRQIEKRQAEKGKLPQILVLGGIKTTLAT